MEKTENKTPGVFKPKAMFYGASMVVRKIKALLNKNKEVMRLGFVCLDGKQNEITVWYKPKKTIKTVEEVAGIESTTSESILYSLVDFLGINPMLQEMQKEAKAGNFPDVVMTFGMSDGRNPETGEAGNLYWMTKDYFDTIYWKPYHPTTDNLIAQEQFKKRKFGTPEDIE